MHPIAADRRRLAVYLTAWLLLAALFAFSISDQAAGGFPAALRVSVPPVLLYALFCLAAWFPVRAMPLRASRLWQLMLAHSMAALLLGGVFLSLIRLSAMLMGVSSLIAERSAVIAITGALLYLLAVAFYYLIVFAEDAHRVERREMEVKVLAREAELKALRAQIDPHFLFNSLNSISALCGSNPSSARTLTTLLADYLRRTLRVGASESITLSEEIELATGYLAIERIRFGPRLDVEQIVEEEMRAVRVPPLLLQPLVENAVTHGIAQLIDGGVVRIEAKRDAGELLIRVANPCDPDRPSKPGTGIGLSNTRKRLETWYGRAARLDVREQPSSFTVEMRVPA
jgi:sensor histidine kinase YesM